MTDLSIESIAQNLRSIAEDLDASNSSENFSFQSALAELESSLGLNLDGLDGIGSVQNTSKALNRSELGLNVDLDGDGTVGFVQDTFEALKGLEISAGRELGTPNGFGNIDGSLNIKEALAALELSLSEDGIDLDGNGAAGSINNVLDAYEGAEVFYNVDLDGNGAATGVGTVLSQDEALVGLEVVSGIDLDNSSNGTPGAVADLESLKTLLTYLENNLGDDGAGLDLDGAGGVGVIENIQQAIETLELNPASGDVNGIDIDGDGVVGNVSNQLLLDLLATEDNSIEPETGETVSLQPNDQGVFSIPESGTFTVNAQSLQAEAGYNNTIGIYFADETGEPISGEIIFANVKSAQDDTDPTQLEFDTAAMPTGATEFGFFIIADGARQNPTLANGDIVSFDQIAGDWQPQFNGSSLSGRGASAYFSNVTLNSDNFDHFRFENGVMSAEDLLFGGDQDFNDVAIALDVTHTQSTVINGIDIDNNDEIGTVGDVNSSSQAFGDLTDKTTFVNVIETFEMFFDGVQLDNFTGDLDGNAVLGTVDETQTLDQLRNSVTQNLNFLETNLNVRLTQNALENAIVSDQIEEALAGLELLGNQITAQGS